MNAPKPLLKYLSLWTHPEAFFKAVIKEVEYQQIILFIAGFTLLGEVLEALLWFPVAATKGAEQAAAPLLANLSLIMTAVLASPLLTVLVSFIAAGLVHLGILFFKGQERFFATWKVVAYASVIPVAWSVGAALVQTLAEFLNPYPEQSLFQSDPTMGAYSIGMSVFLGIVAIVTGIHVLYSEMVGLSLYHKLSKGQALAAAVVPFLVAFLLVFLLVFVARSVGGL